VPRVVESAIVAHGPLSTDLVRRILSRHRESIRDCYAAGLARDVMLSGSLLVDLVVLDTGESIHLQTWPDGFADERAQRSIAWELRSISFSSDVGRGPVPLSFHYDLSVSSDHSPGTQ
jgi:hypothetical protein